jgi:uncharacterized protein (DUF433 family)
MNKIDTVQQSNFITINPKIMGGVPVVSGTRIPVSAIAYLHKKLKKSPAVIATKYYTQLSVDQVREILKTNYSI